MAGRIYLDYHATTPVDPRVFAAMAPYFSEQFGNAGSASHEFGREAAEAVEESRNLLATALGADPREIVFTSGATESNNLAIRGISERPRRKGNRIVSVATEHPSVLDPLERLGRKGFEITLLPVRQHGERLRLEHTHSERLRLEHTHSEPGAGLLDLDRFAEALGEDVFLVSVMLANNEIGVIQPVEKIGRICKERGILLHCDATQAVGKIPVDVRELQVDLLSFSAHKIYGPKGIGALYIRREAPRVRIEPQIDGGGQERGYRSGTLNVPGIVGFAAAVGLCLAEQPTESLRLAGLRNRLFQQFQKELPGVSLNGPALEDPRWRLAGNLNVSFAGVDGEAAMLAMKHLAVSSGSACTSANPEPSHVLEALGLSPEACHSSLRFGLGRFTTEEEIDRAAEMTIEAIRKLRRLGENG